MTWEELIEISAKKYCQDNIPNLPQMHLAISTAFEAGAKWVNDNSANRVDMPEHISSYGIRGDAVRQTLLSCLDGGYFDCRKKEDEIYNKAIIKLVLSDSRAIDKFLEGNYPFRFREHKKDKKGKLISVEAFLCEK